MMTRRAGRSAAAHLVIAVIVAGCAAPAPSSAVPIGPTPSSPSASSASVAPTAPQATGSSPAPGTASPAAASTPPPVTAITIPVHPVTHPIRHAHARPDAFPGAVARSSKVPPDHRTAADAFPTLSLGDLVHTVKPPKEAPLVNYPHNFGPRVVGRPGPLPRDLDGGPDHRRGPAGRRRRSRPRHCLWAGHRRRLDRLARTAPRRRQRARAVVVRGAGSRDRPGDENGGYGQEQRRPAAARW